MLASALSRIGAASLLAFASLTGIAVAAGENVSGKWAAPVSLPLVPSSGGLLPNGKVLLWSADGEFSFSTGSQSQTVVFDPTTGSVAKKTVSPGHNLFCTGTTNLADGRILVNGGQQTRATTIYDANTNAASSAQIMNFQRGYNSNTILTNGAVLTVGGSWNGGVGEKKAEVWTPSGGWRALNNVLTDAIAGSTDNVGWARDSHMWLKPAGNGRIFYAGPHPNLQWIDTDGAGTITPAGVRGDDVYAITGVAVMYDRGRILKTGGNELGDLASASSSAYKIDINNGVAVSKISPMAYPRAYANSVVLPDGQVFVVGGQTYAQTFSNANAVMPTELWNPSTGAFTVTAPIAIPRNYHSIALLLPDGRVLSAGGGLCGTSCSANHPDLQIYSPGYLFDSAGALKSRPAIVSAPAELPYGRTVTVTTNREVAAFSIVRVGSTTHTVNNDQRRLALTFVKSGTNTYQISVPSNPGWLLPGNWMLFAIDSAGTPSLSKMVHVTPNPVANLSADAIYSITAGASASLRPSVARLNTGATLFIGGLPPGLSFNAQSGAITGVAATGGVYPVTLSATDGAQTVSIDFRIDVDPPAGDGDGLLADYFSSTNLSGAIVASRVEQLAFADNAVGAGAVMPTAPFSARWSGSLLAQRSGLTQIQTRSDDGVRVWIGGKLVIDNWTWHSAALDAGEVDLVAGVRYPIYVEYFNGSGGSSLRLSWRRPGDLAFAAIPKTQLIAGAALSTENVALGKLATQSSDFSNAFGAAPVAVDGNTNGVLGAGSVTHTNGGANEWWQADLGEIVNIERIRLWNRTDCCSGRLQRFSVFISDRSMNGKSYAQIAGDPTIDKRSVAASVITSNITIPGGVTGRFVRVQLEDADFLSLAEVEVFGGVVNRRPVISGLPTSVSMQIGVAVSQQVIATDPEGQAITFASTGEPSGLSISPSGLVSGVPGSLGSGVATITATDAAGLSTSASVSWTVISGLPSVTRLDVSPSPVNATVTYSPVIADGFGATYRWSFGDGSAPTAFMATSNAAHVYTDAGVYSVTLTMRAADGRQTTHNFNQAIYKPVAAGPRPSANSGAAYENPISGSPRLWVANPDNDSVGVIDLTSNTLAAEIVVGKRPVSVAIHPNGDAWVVNRDSATITVIDATSLTIKRTIALPRASRPYGIVFAGRSGVVTLEAAESAALVTETGAIGGIAQVGSSPRHLTVTAAADSVLISRFITPPLPGESTATVRTVDGNGNAVGGEVIQLDGSGAITRTFVLRHSEQPDTQISARGIPNYLGAPAIAPDGLTAWVPSKQDNIKRGALRDGQQLDFQTSVRAILSKIDLRTGREIPAARVDLDNAGVASAALFHPSGAYVFVALQTSREVAVVDPVGARELFRFPVGRAPSGLALSPDGGTLFVANFMDRDVSRISLAPLLTSGANAVRLVARIRTIGADRLNATVLRGKQLFYDAADTRIARDSYLSCAACHDNAEQDGRVWDFTGFGEGLRNTISMEGRGGMGHGFLHRTANFDEIQDFEGQIRSFAEGSGLMSDADFNAGTRSQTLGDPKAGLSADLDALAAYVASRRTFPESPWRNADGTLTALAQAGKTLFADRGCATCHASSRMTISTDERQLKNIGTIKPASGKRLGSALTGLDVQTLLGVFSTAPYLHDGSAPTLEDAIRAHNTSTLNATQVSAIAAYLKQIGGAP